MDRVPESYDFQIRKGLNLQGYKNILQFSKVTFEPDQDGQKLVIDCPFRDCADALQNEYGEALCRMLSTWYPSVSNIEIRAAGELFVAFPPWFLINGASRTMQSLKKDITRFIEESDRELRQMVDESPYPVSVILMPDDHGRGGHKGLYANQAITEVSGVNLNDWIGRDMLPGWDLQELLKLMEYLKGNKTGRRVSDYTYKAFKLTGEPIELCVDVSLERYQGSLVRVVTNKGMRLL